LWSACENEERGKNRKKRKKRKKKRTNGEMNEECNEKKSVGRDAREGGTMVMEIMSQRTMRSQVTHTSLSLRQQTTPFGARVSTMAYLVTCREMSRFETP
jgi:hypothetical protein